jgi:hypothetical protein
VLVGKDASQKRFTLHTAVFIPRSEFFKAARSKEWTTDPLKPTDCGDEDSEVFENYMRVVYFNCSRALTKGDDLSVGLKSDHFPALIKLYVLADKLIDHTTANKIISQIIAYANTARKLPTRSQVNLGYNLTISGNPLRTLLRDLIVHSAHNGYLGDGSKTLHPDIGHDVAIEYLRIKESGPVDRTIRQAFSRSFHESCLYHQHDSEGNPKCDEPSDE